jgi:hypothetical protein
MNGGSPFVLRVRHWMAALGLAKKDATVASAIESRNTAHPVTHSVAESEIKLLERNIVELPERNPQFHSRN